MQPSNPLGYGAARFIDAFSGEAQKADDEKKKSEGEDKFRAWEEKFQKQKDDAAYDRAKLGLLKSQQRGSGSDKELTLAKTILTHLNSSQAHYDSWKEQLTTPGSNTSLKYRAPYQKLMASGMSASKAAAQLYKQDHVQDAAVFSLAYDDPQNPHSVNQILNKFPQLKGYSSTATSFYNSQGDGAKQPIKEPIKQPIVGAPSGLPELPAQPTGAPVAPGPQSMAPPTAMPQPQPDIASSPQMAQAPPSAEMTKPAEIDKPEDNPLFG